MNTTEIVSLQTIVKEHSNALSDRRLLKALLLDYFPNSNLTVNTLLAAFDHGLVSDLINCDFNDFTWNRYCQLLINEAGLSRENAERAISLWLSAFNITYEIPLCDKNNCSKTIPPNCQTSNDDNTKKFGETASNNRPLIPPAAITHSNTSVSHHSSNKTNASVPPQAKPIAPSNERNLPYSASAVESARLYYDFLSAKNAGVSSVSVRRISRSVVDGKALFTLYLSDFLRNVDTVQIRVEGKDYTQEELKPVEYDKTSRTLKVQPSSLFEDLLATKDCSQVSVVSDLKFLIRKVENWYKQYGSRICLPSTQPNVALPNCQNLPVKPFSDQENAIKVALNSPFSYVWGAPGTGKTRLVLSRCVLAYIQAGKKVLVTAPTNNAVEQTLNGLLPELIQAGYDLQGLVVRIGVPSTGFAEKYPMVCENAAYAKMIAEIEDSITAIRNRISSRKKILDLFVEKEKDERLLSIIELCNARLQVVLPNFYSVKEEHQRIVSEIDTVKKRIQSSKNTITDLNNARKELLESADNYNREADRYQSGLRHLFWSNRENENRTIADQKFSEAKQKQNEAARLSSALQSDEYQYKELSDEYARITAKIHTLTETTINISGLWTDAKELICRCVDENSVFAFPELFDRLYKLKKSELIEKESSYSEITCVSKEEVIAIYNDDNLILQDYIQRKQKLEEGNASASISTCKVLACTLDTCFSRVKPDSGFNIAHIFLDEAGYCSLIKGATLTAFDCPVTMLGDHMQLPPVSEINTNDLKNEKNEVLVLWTQSALYIPDALRLSAKRLCTDYINNEEPSFAGLNRVSLLHTHRFGKKLASVLAGNIYESGFSGSDEHDTDIYYIHAQRIEQGTIRTNKNECDAIVAYVLSHPTENIGIIAPYNNQIQAIKDALYKAGCNRDNVYTVHRAQGREWDTVLFSVTDTYRKFFTDSTLPISNGKNIINTAVSRAKVKLIIVCDVPFWKNQPGQLISKLLMVAEDEYSRSEIY